MKPKRCAAAALAACVLAAPVAASDTVLWMHPPAAAEVSWRGMLATEGGAVGIGPQILYPAAGAAGLLAAILTHAALSQGVQSAQRKREQDEADRVLDPYRAALTGWTAQSLWQAAAAASTPPPALRLVGEAPAPDGPTVELAPVFTLAQDEGVLIADVAVKLVSAPGAAAVDSVVRVVSSPHGAADARMHWSADEARQLKAAAAAMLAHAVQLSLRHAPGDGSQAPTRTHRYLQGSQERSERAQQLSGDCARAVLRTLRGGLLSVPLKPPEDGACPRASAF